jgi:hypothetical protein
MTMQFDVKSAYTGTFPAQLHTGPCRLKQLVLVGSGTAGSVILYDGTDTTGPVVWEQKTSTGVQPFQVLVPGEGIKCNTGIYATGANITSLTVCYG